MTITKKHYYSFVLLSLLLSISTTSFAGVAYNNIYQERLQNVINLDLRSYYYRQINISPKKVRDGLIKEFSNLYSLRVRVTNNEAKKRQLDPLIGFEKTFMGLDIDKKRALAYFSANRLYQKKYVEHPSLLFLALTKGRLMTQKQILFLVNMSNACIKGPGIKGNISKEKCMMVLKNNQKKHFLSSFATTLKNVLWQKKSGMVVKQCSFSNRPLIVPMQPSTISPRYKGTSSSF